MNKQESSSITSLLRYHGRQAVSVGRLRVFIEYLEAVMGTKASVSPLQNQEKEFFDNLLFSEYVTYLTRSVETLPFQVPVT